MNSLPDTLRVVIVDKPAGPAGASTTDYILYTIAGVAIVIAAIIFYRRFRKSVKSSRVKEYGFEIGPFSLKGEVEYYSSDQVLAWKTYVELVTRISGNKMDDESGILREALNSLYALFGIMRNQLKDAGPELARRPSKPDSVTVATLNISVMNDYLRPFLSRWHAALEQHEALRPENMSKVNHERKWRHEREMREGLHTLVDGLTVYGSNLLAIARGEEKK